MKRARAPAMIVSSDYEAKADDPDSYFEPLKKKKKMPFNDGTLHRHHAPRTKSTSPKYQCHHHPNSHWQQLDSTWTCLDGHSSSNQHHANDVCQLSTCSRQRREWRIHMGTSHLQQSTNPPGHQHRIRDYGKLATNLGTTTNDKIKSPKPTINSNTTATNPHHNHKRLSPKSRVQFCRIWTELSTCGAKKNQNNSNKFFIHT